ncbi:unnamed protein product [Adineta steineri]|uniref:EGF-like domain-containing protein n=1 Tax=Adineta steineri TaxID=433720 RepID=A0A819AKW7_9BILA|nr:unnamed protein product [Adineta steineri]
MAHVKLPRSERPSKCHLFVLSFLVIACTLQQAISAPNGSIGVKSISSTEATGANGRRRRDLQCDKTDRSGVAIVFDVALNYPRSLPCQTLACQISLFTSIHEKFNTQSSVNITADDGSNLSVDLCHVQSYPNGNNNNQNSPSGVVIQPCSIVCQNGGYCTGPTTCACTAGWSGDTCTIAICTNGCQNGGTCTAPGLTMSSTTTTTTTTKKRTTTTTKKHTTTTTKKHTTTTTKKHTTTTTTTKKPNQVFFVPSEYLHHIENLKKVSTTAVIIDFSHELSEAFNFSTAFSAMSLSVLAITLQLPAGTGKDLIKQDEQTIIGQMKNIRSVVPPALILPEGSVKTASKTSWSILENMSISFLCISRTSMREPHSHPETAEMGYAIDGYARLTILAPNSSHRLNTFELKNDDVYFVPRAYPHYIENMGDVEVKILLFFDQAIINELSYQSSFLAYSREVLAASFKCDSTQLPNVPFNRQNLFVKHVNPDAK